METTIVTVSRLSQKRFWQSLLTGFVLLSLLIASFGFSGTFFALGLGGMGDFYVKFEKLEGTGFQLNPQVGETGVSDAAPMVRNKIEAATIENLHIYKDLQLPTGNWFRINIVSSQPAYIEGLIQDARFIDANLSFEGLTVAQNNTIHLDEWTRYAENWSQVAKQVTIYDAKIVTDYLFQNAVSLQQAKIYVESIEKPEEIRVQHTNFTGTFNNRKGFLNIQSNVKGGDQSSRLANHDLNLPNTSTPFWTMLVLGTSLLVISIVLIVLKGKFKKG